MRRILIVSPHFPPTNAPDHQRVRVSLPHFREFGWDPVVLAVDPLAVEAPRDSALLAMIPSDIPVHRVRALPVNASRVIGLGNIAYRAWYSLKRRGGEILQSDRFDLVFFSTTQYIATALGRLWWERYRVPFVIDIQDPWRTDYYERPGAPSPPGGWKYHIARWQANRLEPRAWRDAAAFMAVSDDYLAQLRSRYSWAAGKPMATIPFAASEADFHLARSSPGITSAFTRRPNTIHCVSVGAIGPIMRESLAHLFAALREFRDREPTLAARLHLHFIGTSYAAGASARPSVEPLANEFDVSDLVAESPQRIGFLAALKTMLAADAIIIAGSDDPAYNPSKLATCALAKRPTLLLVQPGSAFERSALELDYGALARIGQLDEQNVILAFFKALLRPTGSDRRPAGRVARYMPALLTRQQCELFERALDPIN